MYDLQHRTGRGSFQHTQAVIPCDQMTSGTVASRIRQMAHNQLKVTPDSADTTARWPPLAKKEKKGINTYSETAIAEAV